jgi:hypothetical protein
MKAKVKTVIAVAIVMLSGATTHGQFNPYASKPPSDARTRRSQRERAVATVGPVARELVETFGDEAVAALSACSPAGGRKLAEFHATGELAKLPKPRDLLRVIGQRGHGDDVANFAIDHARELADVDQLDAYLISPLEYALGLRPLATGAAEMRALRLNVQAAAAAPPAQQQPPPLQIDERWAGLLIIGGLGVIGLLVWWKRQR